MTNTAMHPTANTDTGQFSDAEREFLASSLRQATRPARVLIEVGTAGGLGSTRTTLDTIRRIGTGHLWGIEAGGRNFEVMAQNLTQCFDDLATWFTPVKGFADQVLPSLLAGLSEPVSVDFVFLDGGNHPAEQIREYRLLVPHMPVGAQLLSHDAKLRKGKWLVPYLRQLDNWEVSLHELSEVGLLHARKTSDRPSTGSRIRAEAGLLLRRLQPLELLAAGTPRTLKRAMLRSLPTRLVKAMAEGGKPSG